MVCRERKNRRRNLGRKEQGARRREEDSRGQPPRELQSKKGIYMYIKKGKKPRGKA